MITATSQPETVVPSAEPGEPTAVSPRSAILERLADALNERVTDEYADLINRVASRVAQAMIQELGRENVIELFGEHGSRRFTGTARELLGVIALATLSDSRWSHAGDPWPRVLDVLYTRESERLVQPSRSRAQAFEDARMRHLSAKLTEAFKGLPGVDVVGSSPACTCTRCVTAPKGCKVNVTA